MLLAFLCLAAIAAYYTWKGARRLLRRRALLVRRRALLEKYHDASVVERILDQRVWQGMSREQLFDSWGAPVAEEERVLKSKVKLVLKYNRTGRNRFAQRVFVEGGVVVGWEIK